ncbi:MAG: phosphoribosyl-ATP diphosphatase [Clostridiales bacterium]|nr:phosphoribosyl-ATP diphosphatase [Clostridiales bacterium]MCF8021673.1 phosphoribosyl-ATP diphosphatase [Clostridiales bacterium]
MPEGSYTTYLFEKGQDKILKKLGEECAEIIIGAKSNDRENTIYECGDFIYHLLVLLAEKGITPGEIFYELEKRKK